MCLSFIIIPSPFESSLLYLCDSGACNSLDDPRGVQEWSIKVTFLWEIQADALLLIPILKVYVSKLVMPADPAFVECIASAAIMRIGSGLVALLS